jgi:hypothetical protein
MKLQPWKNSFKIYFLQFDVSKFWSKLSLNDLYSNLTHFFVQEWPFNLVHVFILTKNKKT